MCNLTNYYHYVFTKKFLGTLILTMQCLDFTFHKSIHSKTVSFLKKIVIKN